MPTKLAQPYLKSSRLNLNELTAEDLVDQLIMIDEPMTLNKLASYKKRLSAVYPAVKIGLRYSTGLATKLYSPGFGLAAILIDDYLTDPELDALWPKIGVPVIWRPPHRRALVTGLTVIKRWQRLIKLDARALNSGSMLLALTARKFGLSLRIIANSRQLKANNLAGYKRFVDEQYY